jgi:multiple sugar transport system substrate-binding protein
MRAARRVSVLAGGMAAVALGVTACAGGASSSGASGDGSATSLSVMAKYTDATAEGKAFRRQVDAFTAATGIKVDIQQGGESLGDAYETSLAAGKEPDVVSVNLYDKSTGWLANGATVDVTEYIDQWGLRDKIQPEAIKQWTNADGQVQGFPFSSFSWPIWYNTALLAKAGIEAPPTTVDELISDAAALKAVGIGPMAVGGSDFSGEKFFLQVAQQFMSPQDAQKLFAEGGYCGSADAMKGIDLFVKLRDNGVFVEDVQGYTAELMDTAFYTQKVAIMPAGSWAFNNTPADVRPNVVLGGLPVPTGGTYDKPTAYRGYTGSGWWISPNGKKKIDAVKKFITSFYDQSVITDFVGSGNMIPAAVLNDPQAAKNPLQQTAINDLPAAVDFAVMPDVYVPASVTSALTQATASAFGPGVTSKDICAAVDRVYAAG